MKKAIIPILICLILLTGCKNQQENTKVPASNPEVSAVKPENEHTHDYADTASENSNPEHIYTCGNTEIKVTLNSSENKEYFAAGGRTCNLANLLARLDYSQEICKCLPEYELDVEGTIYGVSLGYTPYVRYGLVQAELTQEQAKTIEDIIDSIIAGTEY